MPEHVHLLLSEPQRQTLADALKSLKQGVGRRLIGGFPLRPKAGLSGAPEHFWQKRYYDFNICNYRQFVEKLRYIHRNPVKRGLCERPADGAWSSFRHYATGAEGRVEIVETQAAVPQGLKAFMRLLVGRLKSCPSQNLFSKHAVGGAGCCHHVHQVAVGTRDGVGTRDLSFTEQNRNSEASASGGAGDSMISSPAGTARCGAPADS